MMEAMRVAGQHYGDKIDLVEYKFTEKANIARCIKMGVKNLPCVYVNGQLQWSSIIPSREELFGYLDSLLAKA
jgi:uroporphyrinogen decarboxylase